MRKAALFAVLVSMAGPATSGSESRLEADGVLVDVVSVRAAGDVPPIDELRRAFERVPDDEMRSVLRARLAASKSSVIAFAALTWICDRGNARDLDIALAAIAIEPRDTRLLDTFERTLAAVLSRDPSAFRSLEIHLTQAPREARASFVAAVESAGGLEAAVCLADWSETHADLRGHALTRLGRLAEGLSPPIDESVLGPARRVLETGMPDGLQEAVICVGKLEDARAIPALIALLEHEHAGIRADALWALRRVTSLRLPNSVERWKRWFEGEQAFWNERSESAFDDLVHGDRAHQFKALSDIAHVRTRRHELTTQLAPSILGSDAEVSVLVVREIARLGSPLARVELIAALELDQRGVAVAAWHALRSIERLDLPLDARVWRNELFSRQ